jgi:hypothetical protein
MSSVIVQPGQTIIDLAIQYCGSVEVANELAQLNDKSITDELQVGETLLVPEVFNKRVRQVVVEQSIQPATNLGDDEEGIGYWGIEYDFIIS